MSEAERVLRDSGQGSLKQSGGHRERELRDRWAELLLGDSSCDDVDTELSDIAELLQEYDPDMTVTDTQVQESYKRFCLPQQKVRNLLRNLPASHSRELLL